MALTGFRCHDCLKVTSSQFEGFRFHGCLNVTSSQFEGFRFHDCLNVTSPQFETIFMFVVCLDALCHRW